MYNTRRMRRSNNQIYGDAMNEETCVENKLTLRRRLRDRNMRNTMLMRRSLIFRYL